MGAREEYDALAENSKSRDDIAVSVLTEDRSNPVVVYCWDSL